MPLTAARIARIAAADAVLARCAPLRVGRGFGSAARSRADRRTSAIIEHLASREGGEVRMEAWRRGGVEGFDRIYAASPSLQTLPDDLRPYLSSPGGALHDVDLSAAHPSFAAKFFDTPGVNDYLALAQEVAPDMPEREGRKRAKVTVNALINGSSTGPEGAAARAWPDPGEAAPRIEAWWTRVGAPIAAYIQVIRERIDLGAREVRTEVDGIGEIVVPVLYGVTSPGSVTSAIYRAIEADVLDRLIVRLPVLGLRPILPMYDGIVVVGPEATAERDAAALRDAMMECAADAGYGVCAKVRTGPTWPAHGGVKEEGQTARIADAMFAPPGDIAWRYASYDADSANVAPLLQCPAITWCLDRPPSSLASGLRRCILRAIRRIIGRTAGVALLREWASAHGEDERIMGREWAFALAKSKWNAPGMRRWYAEGYAGPDVGIPSVESWFRRELTRRGRPAGLAAPAAAAQRQIDVANYDFGGSLLIEATQEDADEEIAGLLRRLPQGAEVHELDERWVLPPRGRRTVVVARRAGAVLDAYFCLGARKKQDIWRRIEAEGPMCIIASDTLIDSAVDRLVHILSGREPRIARVGVGRGWRRAEEWRSTSAMAEARAGQIGTAWSAGDEADAIAAWGAGRGRAAAVLCGGRTSAAEALRSAPRGDVLMYSMGTPFGAYKLELGRDAIRDAARSVYCMSAKEESETDETAMEHVCKEDAELYAEWTRIRRIQRQDPEGDLRAWLSARGIPIERRDEAAPEDTSARWRADVRAAREARHLRAAQDLVGARALDQGEVATLARKTDPTEEERAALARWRAIERYGDALEMQQVAEDVAAGRAAARHRRMIAILSAHQRGIAQWRSAGPERGARVESRGRGRQSWAGMPSGARAWAVGGATAAWLLEGAGLGIAEIDELFGAHAAVSTPSHGVAPRRGVATDTDLDRLASREVSATPEFRSRADLLAARGRDAETALESAYFVSKGWRRKERPDYEQLLGELLASIGWRRVRRRLGPRGDRRTEYHLDPVAVRVALARDARAWSALDTRPWGGGERAPEAWRSAADISADLAEHPPAWLRAGLELDPEGAPPASPPGLAGGAAGPRGEG